jgi:hypothetical protein
MDNPGSMLFNQPFVQNWKEAIWLKRLLWLALIVLLAAGASAQESAGGSSAYLQAPIIMKGKTPYLQLVGGEVPLVPSGQFTIESAAERRSGKEKLPPLGRVVPPKVDMTAMMTSVKDQGERSTSTVFAALAALEALPQIPDDLSEQYTYWRFKLIDGHPGGGLSAHQVGHYLKGFPVCEERYWPYNPRPVGGVGKTALQKEAQDPPPPLAVQNRMVGVWESYHLVDEGPTGNTSARNLQFLKRVLASGYPIVTSFHVAGRDWGGSVQPTIIKVYRDGKNRPLPSVGGHVMLLVGYNDKGRYFIAKNSWGRDWGYRGFARISYEYVETYAKDGFFIIRPSKSFYYKVSPEGGYRQRYAFRVSNPGEIFVEVNMIEGSMPSLALILNGPQRPHLPNPKAYYARVDGEASKDKPLILRYQVTDGDLALGDEFTISVAAFSKTGLAGGWLKLVHP